MVNQIATYNLLLVCLKASCFAFPNKNKRQKYRINVIFTVFPPSSLIIGRSPAVNYYQNELHPGCCSSSRPASGSWITVLKAWMLKICDLLQEKWPYNFVFSTVFRRSQLDLTTFHTFWYKNILLKLR